MKSVKSFNQCQSLPAPTAVGQSLWRRTRLPPSFHYWRTGRQAGVIQTIYDIVKAPGGSISVISNYCEPGELKVETATAKEDEGSTFIIQLPIC